MESTALLSTSTQVSEWMATCGFLSKSCDITFAPCKIYFPFGQLSFAGLQCHKFFDCLTIFNYITIVGIGYQTAKSIAKLGGRVVIACRNEEKAKEVYTKVIFKIFWYC